MKLWSNNARISNKTKNDLIVPIIQFNEGKLVGKSMQNKKIHTEDTWHFLNLSFN